MDSSVSSSPRNQSRAQPGAIRLLPPLSALTYYRRNIWRVLPVGGAIVISAFLIAAIVTLLNSVDASITTHYGLLRRFSALTAQFERDVPPPVLEKARKTSGVKRVLVGVPYFMVIKTVFGEMPVPAYGLAPAEMPVFAEATGNKLVEGRFPALNEPEIAVSRAWANNFRQKLGGKIEPGNDRFPTLTDPQTIVGILDGGENIAIADRAYLQLTLPEMVVRPTHLFIPESPQKLSKMSQKIKAIVDEPEKVGVSKEETRYIRLFTYSGLVGELRKSLAFLYRFLAIADALVIGAVALLSGFLANIYFEQRLGEFGLLSALGFRRERLARRLIIETGCLVVVSWVLGLGLTALCSKPSMRFT